MVLTQTVCPCNAPCVCFLLGKADSIQRLQDEIVQKSTKLEQLDVDLKTLLTQLRKKADDLSACQG